MVKGLPKSIIAKYGITKKAWQVFKGKRHKASNPTKRIKKVGGGIRKTMAKRKWRRRGGMTIPLAPVIGLAPMIIPAVQDAMNGKTPLRILDTLAWNTLGVANLDGGIPRFDGGKLLTNVTPLVIGLLVHKFVGGSPLNLNRTLARARVPIIRI